MKRLGNIVLAVVICGLTRSGFSQETFTKIADTSTPVPGTVGTFSSFGLPVQDREDDGSGGPLFFFEADSSNGIDGIYSYPTALSRTSPQAVALFLNTTMAAPTGGTYASFSNISSGFRALGFIAHDSSGVQGVYVTTVYGLIPSPLVAETGSSPVAGITFSNFESLSIWGDGQPDGLSSLNGEFVSNVGIFGFSLDPFGVNPSVPATFTQIATTNSIAPGSSNPFTSLSPPTYKASEAVSAAFPGKIATISAFRATAGGVQGIYYNFVGYNVNSGGLQLLVSTTNSIPDGAGHYTDFGNPIASSSEIAFTADYTTPAGVQQGIFSYGEYSESSPRGPMVDQLLAEGQTAPDSNGAHFVSFGTIACGEAGDDLFTATLDNGIEGLYALGDLEYEGDSNPNPVVLTKILDTSDTLDGKAIADIEISDEAVGYGFVFKVDFADGSEGIFDNLPEPTLLVIPLLAMSLVRSYRGKKSSPNHRMA